MRKDEFPIVDKVVKDSIIAELESLRADINQIDAHQFKRTKVLKILDTRIAELKGEPND